MPSDDVLSQIEPTRRASYNLRSELYSCVDLPGYSSHNCCLGCHNEDDSEAHIGLSIVQIAMIVGQPSPPSPDAVQPEPGVAWRKHVTPFILCCQQRRTAPATLTFTQGSPEGERFVRPKSLS